MSRTDRDALRAKATPTCAPVPDVVGGTGSSPTGAPVAENVPRAGAATARAAWPIVASPPRAVAAANAAAARRTGAVFIVRDRPSRRVSPQDRPDGHVPPIRPLHARIGTKIAILAGIVTPLIPIGPQMSRSP
jgi:hypothetical protein